MYFLTDLTFIFMIWLISTFENTKLQISSKNISNHSLRNTSSLNSIFLRQLLECITHISAIPCTCKRQKNIRENDRISDIVNER